MKNILDKIFKLPPVEERVDIRHSFLRKSRLLPFEAMKEKNDMYIYYQGMLCATILSVVALLIAFMGELLDFGAVYQKDGIDEIFFIYSNVVQIGFLGGLIPFFLVKFRWNVDPVGYDLQWFYPIHFKQISKARKVIGASIFLVMYVYIFFHVEVVPKIVFLAPFNLDQSVFGAGIALLIVSWVLSYGLMVFLLWTFVFYSYVATLLGRSR